VILAAVGAGLYRDAAAATARMIREERSYTPTEEAMVEYERYYAMFRELHDGMQPYFIKLAEVVSGRKQGE
jgi:L-xylulokinase